MRRRVYGVVKRFVDIVVSAVALTLLSPILAAVAVAVLVSMGRPIMFRQLRPGRHGKPFVLVKFRTMLDGPGTDAERLTKVGQFLRSTSLDELPELWNVLKGNMSLVGPRPLLMDYLTLYDARQAMRHQVRPGITGLAQVNGRNQLGWDERLETDAVYVESEGPVIDLRILGKTVIQVAKRDGISADGEATMGRFTGNESPVSSESIIDARTEPVG